MENKCLPSGYVKIAIENGSLTVDLSIPNGDFLVRYVSLPEGIPRLLQDPHFGLDPLTAKWFQIQGCGRE